MTETYTYTGQTYKLCRAFKALVVTSWHRSLDIPADWTTAHQTHVP